MDKFKSKQIWCQMGLATAPFTVLNEDSDWEEVIEGLSGCCEAHLWWFKFGHRYC